MLRFFIFLCLGLISYCLLSIYSLLLAVFRYFAYSCEISDLQKRHVLITGGDSGFGHALALHLARRGLNVHAGCLTSDGGEKLRQKAYDEDISKNVHVVPLDITKDYSIANARNAVQEKLPKEGLWAIVNNAGILGNAFADEWNTIKDFEETMDVNFFGYVRVVHAFRPLMISPDGGRIVIIGSIRSYLPGGYVSPYTASKQAVMGYANSLRIEPGYSKIKVSTLCPGFHKTAVCDINNIINRYKKRWPDLPSEVRRLYQKDGTLSSELPPSVLKRLKFQEVELERMLEGSNIQDVVDAYTHAVTALHPKLTYWPGDDTGFHRLLAAVSDDGMLAYTKLARMAFGDYIPELDQ